ncbi:hypothetical protein PENSPDRAFT_669466 [Peniophora sp. CONT]|nr:hypothetical protein PENSPDRAFT_669466 [Peniophora sp. CONT]
MASQPDAPNAFVLLPDDIIRELFEALADIDTPRRAPYRKAWTSSARSPDLGWIRLTHVSRRLRHIGINLSTLWGRVVCSFPSAWETTLARSRNAPLDIYLGHDGFDAYSHWPISAEELLARARYISDIVSIGQPASRSWWINTSPTSLKYLELAVQHYNFRQGIKPLLPLGQITAPSLVSYKTSYGLALFSKCWCLKMHLIDCLSVPTTTKLQIDCCKSPALLCSILERPETTRSVKYVLDISAERDPEPFRNQAHVKCTVAEDIETSSFQTYRAFKPTKNYSLRCAIGYTLGLPHRGDYAPSSIAASVCTLTFHTDMSVPDTPIRPLPETKHRLEQFGEYLAGFKGIATIYIQRESAPILTVLRDMEAKSATEVVFPSLATIVLDVFSSRLNVATWNGFVDLLMYRKASRRPLERLVLMGSHLCHLSPDIDGGVTKMKLDLRPVKGLVNEIVDLRGKKRCKAESTFNQSLGLRDLNFQCIHTFKNSVLFANTGRGHLAIRLVTQTTALYNALAEVDPPRCAGRWSLYVDDKTPPSLGWIKLTHTCRHLRVIGVDMPTLWARAVCVFPSGCKEILARAKDAPLTLDLKAGGLIDYLHLLPAHNLVSRALHIRDLGFNSYRAWWKDKTLSHLESLHLEYRDVRESEFNVSDARKQLSVINAPVLRSYGILGGFIPFHAPALRTLSIDHPVAWRLLLDSLRSCPLLETLTLTDTRETASTMPFEGDSVSLPYLRYISVQAPSQMGVINLLEALVIPDSAEINTGNCSSPDVFHALLRRRQDVDYISPLGDMLSITAVEIGNSPVRYDRSLRLSISQNVERSYPQYRPMPERGITYEKKCSAYSRRNAQDNPLARAITDTFGSSESAAAPIRTLAFYNTKGFVERDAYPLYINPVPTSVTELKHFRESLRHLNDVTTIYTPEHSAHLFMLLPPDSGPAASKPPLFPFLKTVILNVDSSKMNESTWSVVVDALAYLEAEGRPLERLVLMGSHFCHLAPTYNLQALLMIPSDRNTKLELNIEHARALVGEIVDMRDEGCTCNNPAY